MKETIFCNYVRTCCRCGTPIKKDKHGYYCPWCARNMYTVETELVKAVKNAVRNV